MTPEGVVKGKVKKFLTPLISRGVYFHMPVQNGMGAPTLDFVGCLRGRFFAIETKAGDAKPTARQEQTAAAMTAGGAVVFLVDGNDMSLELFKLWVTGVLDDNSQADEVIGPHRRRPASAFVYPALEALVVPRP